MKSEPCCTGWKCKLMQKLWRTVWTFLKRLGINFIILSSNLYDLNVYTEKVRIQEDACSNDRCSLQYYLQ